MLRHLFAAVDQNGKLHACPSVPATARTSEFAAAGQTIVDFARTLGDLKAGIGAATDNLIRAIDIETGETVWQDVLPAGGQATPMVYEEDGRQFVAIFAGGHHFMETPIGDYLIAYASPQ